MTAAENVSRNVRRLRRARGWTQQEAGLRFGDFSGQTWSGAVWSNAEKTNGGRKRAWTANELTAVAALFGVTVSDLFAECCCKCGGAPPEGFTCNTCGGTA